MLNTIKVSICIPTYNHEKFIRKCLDSVLEQECTFEYEIIIGDDCSTDGSRNIIVEYVNKFPEIIKPIFHKKNIGGEKNYLSVHEKASGKYICHLDGDDYMLPGKLQTQVNFMDNHLDCNICFHRVKVEFEDGTIKDDLINYEQVKNGFTRQDLLLYMAVATHSSKMYRSELRNFDMPNFVISDFYMNVEQIEDKKAYFVNNECYGVYRAGIGQSSNSRQNMKNMIYSTLKFFLKKYPENKKYINSLFLILFLSELKNRRSSFKYFSGWVSSFCFESLFISLKSWSIRKMFRWPKG